jgi:uncharacterized membrane protein YbhN (UPF0104 family)
VHAGNNDMNVAAPREMHPTSRALRIRGAAVSIIGLALLAGLIWFANPTRVLDVLRSAELGWITLALIVILMSTTLGAINSYLIAAPGPGLRFKHFLCAYWVAWAFGQVVPGQVADLVGMSLFLRKRGLALPTAVGRLGVDKLVSLFCTFLLSASLALVFVAPVARLAGVLGAGAAAVLVVAYMASRRWKGAAATGNGLRAHFVNSMLEAHQVIATRPRAVIRNAALTIVKLFAIGVCYWAVFHALHAVPGNLFEVTVTANSAGLIAYVPISANGLGTVEAGGLYLFGLRGVAAPVVVATYLLLRFANLALAWAGAALVLLVRIWR